MRNWQMRRWGAVYSWEGSQQELELEVFNNSDTVSFVIYHTKTEGFLAWSEVMLSSGIQAAFGLSQATPVHRKLMDSM